MTTDPTPQIVQSIFDAFNPAGKQKGGLRVLAEAIGSGQSTVFDWKKNGIPTWRRPGVLMAAQAKGVTLPPDAVKYLDPNAGETAQSLADRGIEQVSAHAERVREGWNDDAFASLVGYVAITPGKFSSEDLRTWAYANGLDVPVDERAWGAVMRRAKHRKIIKHAGYKKSAMKNSHGAPANLWKRIDQ